jgi:hypothetical protein
VETGAFPITPSVGIVCQYLQQQSANALNCDTEDGRLRWLGKSQDGLLWGQVPVAAKIGTSWGAKPNRGQTVGEGEIVLGVTNLLRLIRVGRVYCFGSHWRKLTETMFILVVWCNHEIVHRDEGCVGGDTRGRLRRDGRLVSRCLHQRLKMSKSHCRSLGGKDDRK